MAVKLVSSVGQKTALPMGSRGQIEEVASTLNGKNAGFIFNKMFPKVVCSYEERPSQRGYCMRCSLINENGVMAEGIAAGATQGKAREAARFEAINTLFMALGSTPREQLYNRIMQAPHYNSYDYLANIANVKSLYNFTSSDFKPKKVTSLRAEVAKGPSEERNWYILKEISARACFFPIRGPSPAEVEIRLGYDRILKGIGPCQKQAEAHALFNLLDTMKEFNIGNSNS